MSTGSFLDSYVQAAPSVQNALDIFAGEWASRLPPPWADFTAGESCLFEDSRLVWGLEELGGCAGQRVLELGPLEGGHSYVLESLGAASVLAIEANTRAFLKCLIVKEILDLKRVHFVCGDFIKYLEGTTESFDLILAAGVLYHMEEPLRLIRLLGQRTRRMYMWTHYYDEQLIRGNPNVSPKFSERAVTYFDGFPCTMHRQDYQSSVHHKRFCGGGDEYSYWLERADILRALEQGGFRDVRIGPEEPQHPFGPCFALVAMK